MTEMVFNHVGLCVTDLERSRRFYEQALGFRFWWELDAPEEGTSTLLRLPSPVGLQAVYLVHGGLVLELLHYRSSAQAHHRRAMNVPGLTHLSLSVQDMVAAKAKVVEFGGSVLDDTDIEAAVMVTDPDGQLVELTSWQWRDALPPLP